MPLGWSVHILPAPPGVPLLQMAWLQLSAPPNPQGSLSASPEPATSARSPASNTQSRGSQKQQTHSVGSTLYCGLGEGYIAEQQSKLKAEWETPSDKPLGVSTSGKLTPTSIHRPYSPPVHSPGTSRPLSVMLAEKPREEGQGQPWGEIIHSSLPFIPDGAGPRSDHGLGQPQRDKEELAKDQTPEKAWSGCGASRGERGP